MSWDEALFSAAFDATRRWLGPKVDGAVLERRVVLEPEVVRLERLARLLSGLPLTLQLTDDAGGWSGDTLLLPKVLDGAPTRELNEAAVVARLAWACASRLCGLVRPRGAGEALALVATALAVPMTRARLLEEAPTLAGVLPRLERAVREGRVVPDRASPTTWAIENLVQLALGAAPAALGGPAEAKAWGQAAWALAPAPGVPGEAFVHEPATIEVSCTNGPPAALAEALRRLPPLPATKRRLFSRAEPRPAPVWLWGELLPASRATGGAAAHEPHDDASAGAGPDATERQKKVTGRIERVKEPDNQLAENPLVHSFEKVHTLETYQGGSKRIDGDDELAAHEKALDELDLRQVVRSHQRARSVYKADLFLDGGGLDDGPDQAPAEFRYDEWDEAKHQWLREWCRVTSKEVPVVEDADARLREVRLAMARTTTGLRRVFEQLEAGRAWRLRQRQGPDVDVDAVISRYGALKAGHTGEDRLYASRRRHTRDTAVLVLLDASLSTDSWVANRRVMDVEREAVVALGDALDGLFDEVGVSAFCSQTRRDCRSLTIKRFDEPWALGARRLVSLEPAGYTRIGAAVRHATEQLLRCGAKKKLLLIVSDGKPSDLDRYEGRHGVADVHRAVTDAQQAGVVAHALAVDPAAHRWLPAMFGHGRASVVDRPERLVHALATVTSTALAK